MFIPVSTETLVLVRFGRWKKILELERPKYPELMLSRTASLRFARAVAYASLGEVSKAKKEADLFDVLRTSPEAGQRILHNNYVSSLLNVDAPMMRGEIAYREGKYEEAFALLREAVALQDGLSYDEPWGVMQPIRHALGGLLLEQGRVDEAESVFQIDLYFHPKNPWGLLGLISCLEAKVKSGTHGDVAIQAQLEELRCAFAEQRDSEWADFEIKQSCECCGRCISRTLKRNEDFGRAPGY